mmetsp:Transcript_75876/g.201593  ORF Transcript_75876/g.201593 Transcript_75876/m.201593 type:complete len:699 (-) Transcript_75876:177-2273(-)
MAKGGLAAPRMVPAPPMFSQRTSLRMERVQAPSTASARAPACLPCNGLPASKARSAVTLLSAAPGLAAGTLASAVTLAASVRRAQKQSSRPSAGRQRASGATRRRAAQSKGAEPVILAEVQPQRFDIAKANARKFNFSKLESYDVQELEKLYIDSKWTFYSSDRKIIEDRDFDRLKEVLKKLGSEFANLNREEVAFIEASIAYYQGTPIMSDEEYEELRKKITMSGRRKDVTALVLKLRGGQFLNDEQLQSMNQAFALATYINFDKLEKYSLVELEELFIDSLWCYYRERKPLISDKEYDQLKQALYARESNFPTLSQTEVAFIEVSIAYYRGEPLISDQEYDKLKAEVNKMGQRKEVVAFLLYERGEQFLSTEQFEDMKDEYEKLGIQAVDLEQCNLAQMEEMYVDAIWAYYKDGVQLLTDTQYDKLRQELQWQGSGFPTLRQTEVEFVKATLSYWRGEPVATDEEWKALKAKVLADGKRKDVTAFLLYSKGREALDPDTFEEMKEEMAKLGVTVQKAGTKALEQTLSITSDKLENDLGQVTLMIAALSALPTILCTVVVWSIGLFFDLEFVPQAEWASVLTAEFVPLFLVGLVLGLLVTWQLFVFLDLQNPEILVGVCPSCGSQVKSFSGGASPAREVVYSCKECGCKMVLNVSSRKIGSAGLGAKIEGDSPGGFDWSQAWQGLKKAGQEQLTVDA